MNQSGDDILFTCPGCHRELCVPRNMGGVSGPCPVCQTSITAPVPTLILRSPTEAVQVELPLDLPPAPAVPIPPSRKQVAEPETAPRPVPMPAWQENRTTPTETAAPLPVEPPPGLVPPPVGSPAAADPPKKGKGLYVVTLLLLGGATAAVALGYIPLPESIRAVLPESVRAHLPEASTAGARPVTETESGKTAAVKTPVSPAQTESPGEPIPPARVPEPPPAEAMVRPPPSQVPVPEPPASPPAATTPQTTASLDLPGGTPIPGKNPAAASATLEVPALEPEVAVKTVVPADPAMVDPAAKGPEATLWPAGEAPAPALNKDVAHIRERLAAMLSSTGALAQSSAALIGFLSASSVEERLKYTLSPEKCRKAMASAALKTPVVPILPEAVEFVRMQPTAMDPQRKYFAYVVFIDGRSDGIPLMVEETAGGCRVEWQTFQECLADSLDKFYAAYTPEIQDFRVFLKRSHYFSNDVPEQNKKVCLKVESPDMVASHTAWADVDSVVNSRYLSVEPRNNWDTVSMLVVRLKWEKTGDVTWVRVTDIRAESWHPDDLPAN